VKKETRASLKEKELKEGKMVVKREMSIQDIRGAEGI